MSLTLNVPQTPSPNWFIDLHSKMKRKCLALFAFSAMWNGIRLSIKITLRSSLSHPEELIRSSLTLTCYFYWFPWILCLIRVPQKRVRSLFTDRCHSYTKRSIGGGAHQSFFWYSGITIIHCGKLIPTHGHACLAIKYIDSGITVS